MFSCFYYQQVILYKNLKEQFSKERPRPIKSKYKIKKNNTFKFDFFLNFLKHIFNFQQKLNFKGKLTQY